MWTFALTKGKFPRKVEEREEAQGGFAVAGADTAKVFELIEHALDQISLLVEVFVIAPPGACGLLMSPNDRIVIDFSSIL